jgi:hypothetical protein
MIDFSLNDLILDNKENSSLSQEKKYANIINIMNEIAK